MVEIMVEVNVQQVQSRECARCGELRTDCISVVTSHRNATVDGYDICPPCKGEHEAYVLQAIAYGPAYGWWSWLRRKTPVNGSE